MLQAKLARTTILILVLAFYGYCNYYYWLVVPFENFLTTWDEGHTATVIEVRRPDLPLKKGDQLLRVNGIAVYRGQIIYRPPRQDRYLFTIKRDREVQIFEMSFERRPDTTALSYRLPATLLAGTFLLLGGIGLFLTRQPTHAALSFSYIMLFSGTVIIAFQGSILNVPGTLYIAHPGFFLMGVGWVYLGQLYDMMLSKLVKVVLYIVTSLAIILAIIALWEIIYLYPTLNSVEALTGFNVLRTAYLFFGLCLLISLTLLVVQTIRTKNAYQKQNTKIVLLLQAIAIVPTVFLTFLSQSLQESPILPFPVAIILFLLVPLSYFFVIFRRGVVYLDVVFHRGLVVTLVLILSSVLFSAIQFLLRYTFDVTADVMTSVSVFLPTYLIAHFAYGPTNHFARRIIYGDIEGAERESLPMIAREISRSPQPSTLQTILSLLAEDFQIPNGLLIFRGDGVWQTKARVNCQVWQSRKTLQIDHSLLRSGSSTHPTLDQFPWSELIIPIKLRGEVGGLLILARPEDAFFNQAQVRFFERIADVIGIGYDAIRLFETSRQLSAQIIEAQESERRDLALNLHDNALQSLAIVQNRLSHLGKQDSRDDITELAHSVNGISTEIRNVCDGLYPSILNYGDICHVIETVKTDSEKALGLTIQYDVETNGEALETVSDRITKAAFYITKEALNNVAKHAGTDEAQITVSVCEHVLSLCIKDQGIGISTAEDGWMGLTHGHQFGLMGMQDRAHAVDGYLTIEAIKPQGTQVTFQIPLAQMEESFYAI